MSTSHLYNVSGKLRIEGLPEAHHTRGTKLRSWTVATPDGKEYEVTDFTSCGMKIVEGGKLVWEGERQHGGHYYTQSTTLDAGTLAVVMNLVKDGDVRHAKAPPVPRVPRMLPVGEPGPTPRAPRSKKPKAASKPKAAPKPKAERKKPGPKPKAKPQLQISNFHVEDGNVKVAYPESVTWETVQAVLDKHKIGTALGVVKGALAKIGASFSPWEDGSPGFKGIYGPGTKPKAAKKAKPSKTAGGPTSSQQRALAAGRKLRHAEPKTKKAAQLAKEQAAGKPAKAKKGKPGPKPKAAKAPAKMGKRQRAIAALQSKLLVLAVNLSATKIQTDLGKAGITMTELRKLEKKLTAAAKKAKKAAKKKPGPKPKAKPAKKAKKAAKKKPGPKPKAKPAKKAKKAAKKKPGPKPKAKPAKAPKAKLSPEALLKVRLAALAKGRATRAANAAKKPGPKPAKKAKSEKTPPSSKPVKPMVDKDVFAKIKAQLKADGTPPEAFEVYKAIWQNGGKAAAFEWMHSHKLGNVVDAFTDWLANNTEKAMAMRGA
jgi:histone H1/5